MNQFLLVFIGGGFGSYCRFLTSNWVNNQIGSAFPYGTLTVNLTGCLLIGLIAGLPDSTASIPAYVRLLFLTGFLGGFTTFSTYEFESFLLTQAGSYDKALLNLGLSMVLGLIAVGLGFTLTRYAFPLPKGGV